MNSLVNETPEIWSSEHLEQFYSINLVFYPEFDVKLSSELNSHIAWKRYSTSHEIYIYIYMLCFVFHYVIHSKLAIVTYVPISFRVSSLALGQSKYCPSASEATLKAINKIGWLQTTTGAIILVK